LRGAVLCFLFGVAATWPAFAGPCSGVEDQLARVSAKLTLGDVSGAEAMLGPIVASHPDCPENLLAQGRIEAAKGNAPAAANFYVQYTDLETQDSRGFAYFGRLFLDQRDYPKADALSAAALEKNPNDPASLALRGQMLAMKGQQSEGKKLLEKACQLDSNDPEAQYQLGKIFDSEKNSVAAVKYFRQATALNPNDARAWDYLGLNLEPLGELETAEQAYRKALAVNQHGRYYDAFVDYNYGRFLAKRNQLPAAKQHLDRATELAPQVRAVWYERAKLNLRMKNYQQARTDAEKAASTEDPAHVIIDLQLYSLLEQIYARLGETELARKYADLTRETPPPVRGEHR
jgi:tetratricopeptide (TPR) repeat protein